MSPFLIQKPTLRDKKTAFKQWVLGASFRFSLLGLMVFLGVLYVVQTSAISTKGYEIRDLKKQVQDLEKENQNMQFSIANYSSLKSIQERLKGTGMVAVSDVQYVRLAGQAVAMK